MNPKIETITLIHSQKQLALNQASGRNGQWHRTSQLWIAIKKIYFLVPTEKCKLSPQAR